jgi:hypothetical protein
VRADAAPQDVAVIFALLGPMSHMNRSTVPDLWQPFLALVLDGLRATDRPALPMPAAPVVALPEILRTG